MQTSYKPPLQTLTPLDDLLAHTRTCNVMRAHAYLDAREYGDRYAYVDTATGCAYVVDDEDMALLGYMLADGIDDVYAQWCNGTSAIEVDGHYIVQMLDPTVDLDTLRSEAAQRADFTMVVAIDLLRPTLEAILADANDVVGRQLF